MKRKQSIFTFAIVTLFVAFGNGCRPASAAGAGVNSTNLANGIRVVSVHFPGSTNVSVFTFLPMGLTGDGPGQAQWSHLVEHLVIRSTMPADSRQANAETLPDHMRLDFYGNTANWQEGLSHHRRWLEGVPFTEAVLAAEESKVIAECDFTARNFATHKFAVAAWSQGFRHGAKHVALKGDVTEAKLADVQRFRDERLSVSNEITVCIVAGLEEKVVLAEAEKQLGGLRPRGVLSPASKPVSTRLDLTWDLDARHLLVTWQIPNSRRPRHAELMVAAQWLNMQFASDQDLKRQIGMAFAGADLATPEGNAFYVSASLRPEASVEAVGKTILRQVERLAASDSEIPQATLFGRQLAASLTELPDARMLKAQAPPGMSVAMLEGNLGLQAGLHEHRYGDHKAILAKQLADVSAGKVQRAVREHLASNKAAVCVLRPASSPVRPQ